MARVMLHPFQDMTLTPSRFTFNRKRVGRSWQGEGGGGREDSIGAATMARFAYNLVGVIHILWRPSIIKLINAAMATNDVIHRVRTHLLCLHQ